MTNWLLRKVHDFNTLHVHYLNIGEKTVRSKSLWFLALSIMLTLVPRTASAQTAVATCPGAPATRLINGATAVVAPGSANNIRSAASTSAKIIAPAQPDDTLVIIGGPTCADGYLWWHVVDNGNDGWTVEGSGKTYFLNPTSTDYQIFNATTNPLAVSYKTLSFTYNGALGNPVLAETVNAVSAIPNSPTSDDPQHLQFSFGAWTDEMTFYRRPHFAVYAVKDIRTVAAHNDTSYVQLFNDFVALLKNQPALATIKEIPVFPPQNAAQVFHLRNQYIKFNGGTGIRFLTQYAQDAGPISNERLMYMFVGMTDDGQYYFLAQMPISDKALVGNENAIPQDYNATNYADQYTAYMKASMQTIEQSKADDFTPHLTDIDALFASMNTKNIPN